MRGSVRLERLVLQAGIHALVLNAERTVHLFESRPTRSSAIRVAAAGLRYSGTAFLAMNSSSLVAVGPM